MESPDSGSLVDSVGFDLIGSGLGEDVESALQVALAGGAVFPNGTDPLSIFRQALSASIRDIESHPRVVRIAVLPSDWKLPRSFRYEDSKRGSLLRVDRGGPPRADDEITQVGDNEWRITLRWSREAIAEASYEMTFWYMTKIGEVVYSESVPKGWEEMTPAEAGRNAAKMMLYYAILRCRTVREEQRAIALYNSYGFGYALGMNFRDAEGRREMLWPKDLDQILAAGKTESGCTIC